MTQAPDTQFEKKAPDGFTVPPQPTKTTQYATWYEYVYENGAFVKKQYGVGFTGTTDAMTPATGETHKEADGKWTMKSGYGISLSANPNLTSAVSGYLMPSVSAYTGLQYSLALFPEYGYSLAAGQCTTLQRGSYDPTLPRLSGYGRVHFTPLWYPDGDYTVRIQHSDAWTPSGMLTLYSITNSITIAGNAYDDHYIGR